MFNINGVYSEENFNISSHTTYGLGGFAKIAYFPKTHKEARDTFDFVTDNFEQYFILGKGSNILASNSYYDGAVICTANLNNISYENGFIKCGSGTTVNQLLKFCLKNGLTGLEYLAGIPATVGGLALMNGGINVRHIGDDIARIEAYNGKLLDFDNKSCNFGYKHSIMRDINAIILAIHLNCVSASRDSVKNNIDKYLKFRNAQPKGKSCGCVFKNINGESAGKIIEEAGLKGTSLGCAQVSSEHANFIINQGNNSDDVYSLIKYVKKKVFEHTEIMLEEEVVYIGKFNETDV
ncbi:MAG: UDP-N-acetylmuramate dehydrogenase [Clostridia bacterium]|nr:UDP-N-acetylmuramate dehydrogenase [Clostridia bacterium]